MDLNTSKSTVTFNREQAIAVDLIEGFIGKAGTNNKFILTGPPGSGKTFILNYALRNYRGTMYGATLSHAAKNVLMSATTDLKMDYYSIAQLVGASKEINGEEILFTPKIGKRAPIVDCNLLVVDEVSMIDDPTVDLILKYAAQCGFKVLFVGDPYQLPPVGQEEDSQIFQLTDCELVESMRFSGPIGDMAVSIRNEIHNLNHGLAFNRDLFDNVYKRKDNIVNGTGYRFELDSNEFLEYMSDQIKQHPGSINHARVLAYMNNTIDIVNDRMRTFIYGKHLNQFEPNEILICEGGYSSKDRKDDGRVYSAPILYNGQILRFVDSKEVTGPYDVPCLVVSVATDKGDVFSKYPIYVVDKEKGMDKYDEVQRKLYANATANSNPYTWSKYHDFKESFATLRYAYCSSTHKSQGLTINTVGVMEGEIMSVRNLSLKHKLQSLYVSLTRPKQELIIFNKHA